MAAENRSAGRSVAVLQALQSAPHAYSFYQAVRLLECCFPALPRVGTSRRLRDDAFRIGQEPELDFAPATLSGFKAASGASGKPRVTVRFQGLMGPNGALPLHLTEYARDRLRNSGDPTLVHFLDVFHHRLLSLFYRAWAEAQPVVSLDRAASDFQADNFGRWTASLAGYGMKSLRGRDSVPDSAKLAGTGLFARNVRNADGLATIVADYFQVPARVQPWHPQWLRLSADNQSQLGFDPSKGRLGRSAVLGSRVWDCQSNFLLVLGPLSHEQFERFLPGQPSMQRLKDWVMNYCNFELGCRVRLVLKKDEVPAVRMGKAGQLGRTSWLGTRRSARDADDLELRVV
jgi:type VI secretion system protein ImpH